MITMRAISSINIKTMRGVTTSLKEIRNIINGNAKDINNKQISISNSRQYLTGKNRMLLVSTGAYCREVFTGILYRLAYFNYRSINKTIILININDVYSDNYYYTDYDDDDKLIKKPTRKQFYSMVSKFFNALAVESCMGGKFCVINNYLVIRDLDRYPIEVSALMLLIRNPETYIFQSSKEVRAKTVGEFEKYCIDNCKGLGNKDKEDYADDTLTLSSYLAIFILMHLSTSYSIYDSETKPTGPISFFGKNDSGGNGHSPLKELSYMLKWNTFTKSNFKKWFKYNSKTHPISEIVGYGIKLND